MSLTFPVRQHVGCLEMGLEIGEALQASMRVDDIGRRSTCTRMPTHIHRRPIGDTSFSAQTLAHWLGFRDTYPRVPGLTLIVAMT